MSVIQKKIPHRATLANTITDLLAIDKDAVYRRLRGEVSFTFPEIALIARSFGISIDNIIGIETMHSKPGQLQINKYVNPTESDYETFEDYVRLLKSFTEEPESKLMAAGNMFQEFLYMDYENFTRFNMFLWNQASGLGEALPFHEITIPDRLRATQMDNCKYARDILSATYIFDNQIFQRIVESIQYFAKVRLIKDEDVALLKKDLMLFLNNLENLAIKGKHEETGNEVSLYISDIYCDTNYTCLQNMNFHLTLFWTYLLAATASLDKIVYNETYAWINSLQRMSTLISFSGEKIRTAFFNMQREIIDKL